MGYQFDPFVNLSDPHLNFKLRLDLKLNNLTKEKSWFIITKLPPKGGLSIISFVDQLEEADNEYNKAFLL